MHSHNPVFTLSAYLGGEFFLQCITDCFYYLSNNIPRWWAPLVTMTTPPKQCYGDEHQHSWHSKSKGVAVSAKTLQVTCGCKNKVENYKLRQGGSEDGTDPGGRLPQLSYMGMSCWMGQGLSPSQSEMKSKLLNLKYGYQGIPINDHYLLSWVTYQLACPRKSGMGYGVLQGMEGCNSRPSVCDGVCKNNNFRSQLNNPNQIYRSDHPHPLNQLATALPIKVEL